MAQKYFTLFDFMARFPNEQSCIEYLCFLKWDAGYSCLVCGGCESNQGKKKHNKRCKECGHEESPTSHSLFHKIKFPLQKAFYTCYQLSVNIKGMFTLELSRQYGLSQKTCWFFKRKVQKAMESSDQHCFYPYKPRVIF